MVVLVGRRGTGGGVYWQITQPEDPDVLTMVFPEQVATDAAVPDVSLPEVVGEEAWTLDFEAVRAHLESQSLSRFPGWASGRVSATPSEVGPSMRFDLTPEMVGRVGSQVGPQDSKDVTRDIARDLTGMAGELAALKADARQWLTDPEHADLHLRLGNAHVAVEAALVEARRRVRMDEGRG